MVCKSGVSCLILLLALGSWVHAEVNDKPVSQASIDRAIEQGEAYLKSSQGDNGSWGYSRFPGRNGANRVHRFDPGVTALAGLALLESKVKPNDPIIRAAASFIRESSADMNWTHVIGLAILFLDKLHNPQDKPLIQTLAARLLAGQQKDGGWGYLCPRIAVDDVRQIKPGQKFLNEIARLARKRPTEYEPGLATLTENSCSEFAVMGLWAARRYQVPVSRSLGGFEKFCRRNQRADGTFPYGPVVRRTSMCMTCTGLLGLAYCHGAANQAILQRYQKGKAAKLEEDRRLTYWKRDMALRKGFAALEKQIQKELVPSRDSVDTGNRKGPKWQRGQSFRYLTLWSVERAAVIYQRDKIGKIDWYHWGARLLVVEQSSNGSWGNHTYSLDTAFALLFLRRAHLTYDLHLALQGQLSSASEKDK